MSARILVTDDDAVSCQLFSEVLEKEGYQVDRVQSGEETLAQLKKNDYDLLLVDVRMPLMSGLDVARTVRKEHLEVPVVVMTAFGSIETAIEAIREGAYDYISKPMNLEELKKTVARAVKLKAHRDRGEEPTGKAEDGEQNGTVIGKSAAMVEVYKTVAKAAPTKSTVLILGESGTGKELIARAIHQHSQNVAGPFVAVDCCALTETLLESELFGHVKGAFTGAVADKRGVFEEAERGTCFLDEIGDIGPIMQAKLLRVLQEQEVKRVGAQKWTRVDVRVIAATNKNLEDLVRRGAFREDLYYRLKVVTIYLPALRERHEDIDCLAQYFLRRYSHESGKTVTAISGEAMDLLRAYSWPGNIRELENAIEQAVVFSSQPVLTPEDLPVQVRENARSNSTCNLSQSEPSLFSDTPSLEEVKKRYVLHVLERTRWNISQAAKTLNIDRRSLYRMLARYKNEPFSRRD
ncbi:MAG TPA: sigma-54 dependent transcriptional regulator [Candidatus Binatia bacterium]